MPSDQDNGHRCILGCGPQALVVELTTQSRREADSADNLPKRLAVLLFRCYRSGETASAPRSGSRLGKLHIVWHEEHANQVARRLSGRTRVLDRDTERCDTSRVLHPQRILRRCILRNVLSIHGIDLAGLGVLA